MSLKDHLKEAIKDRFFPERTRRPYRLHTNACGDFTLLASDCWTALRGYAEYEMYSLHLDSLLCYAAHHGGAREKVLSKAMRIYHIEHAVGSGYTSEGADTLYERLNSASIPYLKIKQLFSCAIQMRRERRSMIFNPENWGLADEDLKETRVFETKKQKYPPPTFPGVTSRKNCELKRASPMSGRFVLITGIGRCGTKWLSTVLHHPESGMVCFHEHKNLVLQLPWQETLQRELEGGIDGFFDPYFGFMRDQLHRYPVVGDSGSWTMARIPEIDKKLPIDRITHLVRNGIQNVHSAFSSSAHRPRDDWMYTHYLPWYWELLGKPCEDLTTLTTWGCWCFAWSQQNLLMPSWMEKRLGPERVSVWRLEDLTGDVEELRSLIREINPNGVPAISAAKKIQKIDVNRRIKGDRSPKALWSNWTVEQREDFNRICGPTMEHYGYDMP